MSCKSRQTPHTHGGQSSCSLLRNLLLLGGDLYENHSHVPNYLLMSMQNCESPGTRAGNWKVPQLKRVQTALKSGLDSFSCLISRLFGLAENAWTLKGVAAGKRFRNRFLTFEFIEE